MMELEVKVESYHDGTRSKGRDNMVELELKVER